jgi:hypothetical protein
VQDKGEERQSEIYDYFDYSRNPGRDESSTWTDSEEERIFGRRCNVDGKAVGGDNDVDDDIDCSQRIR